MIIIDEISMVRADIIDCVDRILRVYSGNMRLPLAESSYCSWEMSSSWNRLFRRIKRDIEFVLCEPFLFLGSCVQGH